MLKRLKNSPNHQVARPGIIPRRAAGVLLPIFSLPNQLGSGDFGPGAYKFIDWLHRAGQSYWMILPFGPVDPTGSPYASSSACAWNWLFISPELLMISGYLTATELRLLTTAKNKNRRTLERRRMKLLKIAYHRWSVSAKPKEAISFKAFCRRENGWLGPFSLFMALKDEFGGQPWWRWPATARDYRTAIKLTNPAVLARRRFYQYTQWIAEQQWRAIRAVAHRQGIKIIGDLPFTVRHDSADVWSRPELFFLRNGRLTEVGGMPPDSFSHLGQRWGTPLYRWSAHRRENFQWWLDRLNRKLRRVDLLRLDHFQGYVHTWNIPARSRNIAGGHWQSSPGDDILRRLRRQHHGLPFIAEDLGLPLPAAQKLRLKYGLPGIRLFEYAWSGLPDNFHELDVVSPDIVFMTSNHDLPPLRTWWLNRTRAHERRKLASRHKPHDRPWEKWIALSLQTRAQLVITTLPDLLGLGAAAQINRPGTKRGNWRWQLTDHRWWAKADELRRLTQQAGRCR